MPDKATTDENTQKAAEFPLESAIESFNESLAALRDFVSLIGTVLSDRQKALLKKHRREFLPIVLAVNALEIGPKLQPSEVEKMMSELGGNVSFKVEEQGKSCQIHLRDDDVRSGFLDLMEKWKSGSTHENLLYRSALIGLISSAEWFISQVIRQHLEEHPEIVADKSLTLRDLKSLGSVSDAQQLLIDSRVDEIIRGSFEDWLKYLKESLTGC